MFGLGLYVLGIHSSRLKEMLIPLIDGVCKQCTAFCTHYTRNFLAHVSSTEAAFSKCVVSLECHRPSRS